MIQRIQTIWLLLTLACMVAFIAMPFGTLNLTINGVAESAMLFPYDFIGLLIPAALAGIMALIAIFTFRNLGLQRNIVTLSLLMTIVTIGLTAYILFDKASTGEITWRWEPAFLAVAAIFEILAMRGISHDIKLLRSYDRLR